MLYYRAASTEEGHVKAGHGNFNQMMSRARMNCETLDTLKAQGRESRVHGSPEKQNVAEDTEEDYETDSVSAMPAPEVTNIPKSDLSQRAATI